MTTEKKVPREPTEQMWGGLARDLIMWMQMAPPHTGEKLHYHLRRAGREIPDWLAKEIPDRNASPSKGTIAVCIWRAMFAAVPDIEGRRKRRELALNAGLHDASNCIRELDERVNELEEQLEEAHEKLTRIKME